MFSMIIELRPGQFKRAVDETRSVLFTLLLFRINDENEIEPQKYSINFVSVISSNGIVSLCGGMGGSERRLFFYVELLSKSIAAFSPNVGEGINKSR